MYYCFHFRKTNLLRITQLVCSQEDEKIPKYVTKIPLSGQNEDY